MEHLCRTTCNSGKIPAKHLFLIGLNKLTTALLRPLGLTFLFFHCHLGSTYMFHTLVAVIREHALCCGLTIIEVKLHAFDVH